MLQWAFSRANRPGRQVFGLHVAGSQVGAQAGSQQAGAQAGSQQAGLPNRPASAVATLTNMAIATMGRKKRWFMGDAPRSGRTKMGYTHNMVQLGTLGLPGLCYRPGNPKTFYLDDPNTPRFVNYATGHRECTDCAAEKR